jgi:hypothetical protein
MNHSVNQNNFLVGSIQQYVNTIHNVPINQQQSIPKMRSITKARSIVKSSEQTFYLINSFVNLIKIRCLFLDMPFFKHEQSTATEQNCYQLWSGVNYLTNQSNETTSTNTFKRNHSESSTLSTSPSSSNESTGCDHYQKKELPSVRAYTTYNNLSFLTKSNTTKLSVCCSFCKNNGEKEAIYTSHAMKNSKGKVTCPLLKIYKCPVCGMSGEDAHTITYCKKYKTMKRENMLNNMQQ